MHGEWKEIRKVDGWELMVDGQKTRVARGDGLKARTTSGEPQAGRWVGRVCSPYVGKTG